MNENQNASSQRMYIEAFDRISQAAKGSKLKPELFEKLDEPLNLLREELELTPAQSVFIAVLLNKEDFEASLNRVAEYLKCSNLRLFNLLEEVKELQDRQILFRFKASYERKVLYQVNEEFFSVIDGTIPYAQWKAKPRTKATTGDFFDELKRLYELLDDGLEPKRFRKMATGLFRQNTHLGFVSRLSKILEDTELYEAELLAVLTVANRLVNHNDDRADLDDLSDVWKDTTAVYRVLSKDLTNGKGILFEKKILEPGNDGGLFNLTYFRFTAAAKKELLYELGTYEAHEKPKNTALISASLIQSKELFFHEFVQTRIDELTRLLSKDNLSEIQERMKEAGFRFGLNCLFYGTPGTGKTEAALQIAKETGRDILKIDFGRLKSAWVGESEKNVKDVFDEYRDICQNASTTPILLFNEADAIFGLREERAEKAVEKMENTIQNIILEEMESLQGILFATTNLAQNLDPAFERRFLYKVRFDKPDLLTRARIWSVLIPELSSFESSELAEAYDFTGGQIENVARLYMINKLLFKESLSRLETIEGYCRSELLA